MSDATNRSSGLELRSGPLITAAAIAGAGAVLLIAGLAVGGSHVVAATRRWVNAMEVPPAELARLKWAQAKAAAAAGAGAWNDSSPGHDRQPAADA